ncbi:MAG: hypothetical protein ACJAT9_001730 [Polaribacter sp.]
MSNPLVREAGLSVALISKSTTELKSPKNCQVYKAVFAKPNYFYNIMYSD